MIYKILTNKDPYNFVYNNNPYDVVIGLYYNNSLIIDLDQYNNIISSVTNDYFNLPKTLVPFSTILNALLNLQNSLDILDTGAIIQLLSGNVKVSSNKPLIFFIVRDRNNPLYNILKSKYNLYEVSLKTARIKDHSIYLRRIVCSSGHYIITWKKYPPIVCPICTMKGQISKIVGFTDFIYSDKMIVLHDEYGKMNIITDTDLYDFMKKLDTDYKLIIMDISPYKHELKETRINRLFYAVGLLIEDKRTYNYDEIITFFNLNIDDKIRYMLNGSRVDDLVISLPLMLQQIDKFTVLYIDINQKYIPLIFESYSKYNNASIENLTEVENPVLMNVQDLPAGIRYKINNILLNHEMNLVMLFKYSYGFRVVDFTSFDSFYNSLSRSFLTFFDKIDFIVPYIVDFEFETTGKNLNNIFSFIRHTIRSIKIYDRNFDNMFYSEVERLGRVYSQYSEMIAYKKQTIYKLSKIFAILNKKNRIDLDDIRYAIGYFSVIHLLPFTITDMKAKDVLDLYKDYIKFIYNRYLNVQEQKRVIATKKDVEELVYEVLRTGPKTIIEIRRTIDNMRNKFVIKSGINLYIMVERVLNELTSQGRIKYNNGMYSI
ncbi:MAG: hypothetical protein ACP5GJ_02515 [Nanopusillaceae archaeon]